MAKRGSVQRTGWTPLLALLAVVCFVWGLERWRRDAARRAGRSEHARLVALARCLLGTDGATVMRSPDAARRRLRALAMTTPTAPSLTWFDRCLPLSRALASHAAEVDRTTAPASSQTRVAESTRRLAESISRVGLVWRVRSGDVVTDMDPIAEQLAHVALEIDLAGAPRGAGPSGPVAPDAEPAPAGYVIPSEALEPAHPGSPDRFFVGAPLPALAEVSRDGAGGWRVTTLANERSYAWSTGGASVVRVDATMAHAPDGLARLRLFRPGAARSADARVTPIDDALEGIHVAMDAVESGNALWLARWTPWGGTVLSRFADQQAAAVVLDRAPDGAAARARNLETGATVSFDEHVAIASFGQGVVAAYTHASGVNQSIVALATSLADHDEAPVSRIAERTVAGRKPGLAFCPRGAGELLLVVSASREWLVLRTGAGGVQELLRVPAPQSGGIFDERAVVRCAPDALVAYGGEHPRSSPLIECRAGADGNAQCAAVPMPDSPTLSTMPLYATRTASGRTMVHGEWPVEIASGGGGLIAARATGPVVVIARRPGGASAWLPDRVVFDASARAHGQSVEGLGLYAEGQRATLAVAAPDGLHLFSSDDAGATWR